ncbi:PucR family transcriptional regulator [Alicyclobacillus macrosporangiidus]|uniref:PucR family transcriptional regulator n=1 Tax=Alicyclobacillus macrosporangiidus TaxID=392015 RepID=UPI00068C2EB1|nr:helix-turn-helix domain-containing protein [Alicyclobacillus macrosporangiidus]
MKPRNRRGHIHFARTDAQQIDPAANHFTAESLHAARRGRWLLQQLDRHLSELHRMAPDHSFTLEDAHGVLVRRIVANGDVEIPEDHWHRYEITDQNTVYGTIRSSAPLHRVMDETTWSLYSLRLALILTELSEWAATEAERRGEKVQKVLVDGVTGQHLANDWLDAWYAYAERTLSARLPVRTYVSWARDEHDLGPTLREEEVVLRYAERFGQDGLISSRLSPPMLHMLANLPEADLLRLVQGTLGPLLEPDHRHLLDTLWVYLSCDQNASQASRVLYMHRNTLLYRIRHIEQLLGLSLRDLQQITSIWTALQAHELLHALGKTDVAPGGKP